MEPKVSQAIEVAHGPAAAQERARRLPPSPGNSGKMRVGPFPAPLLPGSGARKGMLARVLRPSAMDVKKKKK